ncbi:MAG: hypothetical protein AAFP98_11205 [Pseudomonadota bacterium]
MKIAFTCGLIAALALSAASATAQNRVCGERDKIVAELASKYGEHLQSAGLRNDTTMVEVFASESGSWSILFTRSDGMSCFAATGQAWHTLDALKAVEPGAAL